MINFEEAKRIARQHIGAECDLAEEATIEKPYGWYFCRQNKGFVGIEVGFLVERQNGRILQFGFPGSAETWLEKYEKGWKYESYNLTILRVSSFSETIKALLELDMYYVIPEWEHGVEWRIPKRYTEKDLKQLLRKLPCTFEEQRLQFHVEIFDRINQAKCCEYSLSEFIASNTQNL